MATLEELLQARGMMANAGPLTREMTGQALASAGQQAAAAAPRIDPGAVQAPSVSPPSGPAMGGMQAAQQLGTVDEEQLRRFTAQVVNPQTMGIMDPALRAKYTAQLTNAASNLFTAGVGQARARTDAYQAPTQALLGQAQAYGVGTTADVNRYNAPSVAALNQANAAQAAESAGGQRLSNVRTAYDTSLLAGGVDAMRFNQRTGLPVGQAAPQQTQPVGGSLDMGREVAQEPDRLGMGSSMSRRRSRPQFSFSNLPSFSSYGNL